MPLHSWIGFSAADFAELAAAVAFLVFALRPAFRRLALHGYWCAALLALLPVALRLALLRAHPVPVAAGADDFSYLLLGDTFAHFRLANAVHPMHRFFEAVFILQEPSYGSIYPAGQGMALAFGQLLFGDPWAGVLLSMAALCALSYWMLRGWTTPEWALAGGLLSICEFGPLSQWTNLYWGGSLSAAAGCLIFGALPRFARTRRRRDAALLGVGLAIQLLTRPFELVLLLPVVAIWSLWSVRRRVAVTVLLPMAVLPMIPASALMLLQNKRVTGSWSTLPYQLSRYQYGVPAAFTFQPNPTPHRQLTPEQQLDYAAQSAIHGDGPETVRAYFSRLTGRVPALRFFFLAPLYLALPFFVLKLGLPGYRWVCASLLVLFLGTNFYPYFYPHYLAVGTSLFLLAAIASLESLSRWAAGRRAAHLLLALCGAHFLFWYGAEFFSDASDPEGRAAINGQLRSIPGSQLVFVRYGPKHMFHEWIHNRADIDRALVVWAADLGERENESLRRYYPNRTAWLMEPDAHPPKLTRYP